MLIVILLYLSLPTSISKAFTIEPVKKAIRNEALTDRPGSSISSNQSKQARSLFLNPNSNSWNSTERSKSDNADGTPGNDSQAPSGIYIQNINFGGTGCTSQYSTTAAYSESSNLVSLKFEEFIASTGVGVKASESRKQCQIIIDLRYPEGWSYSFGSVQYRGSLNLPHGFVARQTATYFFAGATGEDTSLNTIFTGPRYNEDYIIDDKFPENKLWSECYKVQPAVIKAAIAVRGNTELTSSFSVSEIEKRVTQDYGVEWRRCS